MNKETWQKETIDIANRMRKRVLGLTMEQGGCYLSQALSSAEILATLYHRVMKLGKSEGDRIPTMLESNPSHTHDAVTGGIYHGKKEKDTDRFLISPAHYAVAIYAALVETGRLAPEGLHTFNQDGSKVAMIGEESSPGFELTTGSFGQCISQAAGICIARKLKGDTGKVFVFLSDGELQEGQTWEAIQAMSFHKIDNVIVYVDVNGQQVDGYTKDVMNIEPINSRFEAFGAKVVCVDGHDVNALYDASLQGEAGKPLVVLCYTDTVRGVPLLEKRKPKLHYVRISNAEMPEFKEFYEKM